MSRQAAIPGYAREHPAHLARSGKGLVPVVFHAERDARGQALDDGVEHRRGDAGDDHRRPSVSASSNVLGMASEFACVEAACTDGRRFEPALSERTRDAVGAVHGVPEPDLDEGQPERGELVEGGAERPVAVGIRVARDPHGHA